jgi:hypothetical protein
MDVVEEIKKKEEDRLEKFKLLNNEKKKTDPVKPKSDKISESKKKPNFFKDQDVVKLIHKNIAPLLMTLKPLQEKSFEIIKGKENINKFDLIIYFCDVY